MCRLSKKLSICRSGSAGSGGISDGGSLERATTGRTKNTGTEANKESRVDATRVDTNDIINQVFQVTKIEELKPDDSAESKSFSFLNLHFSFFFSFLPGSKLFMI